MNRLRFFHRLMVMITAFFTLALTAGVAAAQSAGQLEGELSSLQGQMGAAESNPSTADQVIARLDAAEGSFAKLTQSGKVDKGALVPIFHQLESMLDRMEKTYAEKKDKCIAEIDNGGQCDYDQPEQLALKAAYPLSWLRFTAATTLFDDSAEQSKKLLNESIDGFTASMLAMPDPNLIRENTLGRAYCERELGKFDHAEYDHAIADFKKISEDGTGTQQYQAAQQGLCTTFGKMGKAEEATKYCGGTGGPKTAGNQMLQLQSLFSAEAATSDPAKKAQYHHQIIDVMKTKENDKEGWAVDVAAASKYPKNAIEEFGSSSDPFEKWLLAAVLLSRHDEANAAKYYAEAGATGKYPKAYKFAADIYLREKRYDQVEVMLSKIAAGGGGDAQWAEYLRFSLAHSRWEQGGSKDTALEAQWVKNAEDYLQKFPNGEHGAEMRVQLADRLQGQKKYVEAAQLYSQVKGNPEFTFTARFKAAECYYKELQGAAASAKDSKDNKGPKVDTAALRKSAMDNLNEAIKMAPEAERSSSGSGKKAVHQIHGEAIFMLASILEEDKAKVDYPQVASILSGYESQYPSMNAKFQDIAEWRITALDHIGKYDEVDRDVAAMVEGSKGNPAKGDFIKGLGIDFWNAAKEARAKNPPDEKAFKANAKLTITAYKYFADMAAAGKIPVKNLTGTLSIYAQALQASGNEDEADKIFQQVVKADPASPDANAGLARIAQAKKDWKDAVTLWTTVENTAAESDNLWYDAKYNIAIIYNEQGNLQGACSKLAQTRAEHPTLGSDEMKNQWDALQRKLCLDHKGA